MQSLRLQLAHTAPFHLCAPTWTVFKVAPQSRTSAAQRLRRMDGQIQGKATQGLHKVVRRSCSTFKQVVYRCQLHKRKQFFR